MTPETAFMEAIQATLLADTDVAALVGEQVFDEVPADNDPAEPPYLYVGPINRQRVEPIGENRIWTVRMRLYAESVGFGRKEAWAIGDAAAAALDGVELVLPDPFVVSDIVRVTQAGDVLDDANRFKTVFIDLITTIEREP